MVIGRVPLLLFVLLAFASQICAADPKPEPVGVLEVGVAPSRSLSDHTTSIGPTIGFEVEPIEKWLELEAGVTSNFGPHSTEWSADLLFKKPWTLSSKLEFMAGIGPEWIHTRESGSSRNSLAAEAAGDFMFWPGRNRKFGWYCEPGFEYSFGRGHERSIGVSFGLLIAIGKRR